MTELPFRAAIAALLVALWAAAPTLAQEEDPGAADAAAAEDVPADLPTETTQTPGRGSETNLPVPRYVSLKGAGGNVRRGPSFEHRIDWVFRHRAMPLRIVAEFGHWRRVEDNEGQGGWIHYSLLSGVRTVLVTEPQTELHARADERSEVVAIAQEGVIGKLGACLRDWCEIDADGEDGWVQKTRLWGVDPDEIRD